MMTALMMGRSAMEIMWKRETVTRRVLKTLRRMIIAALKWTWTLLTNLFTGKNKTKCGKVKRFYTHSKQMAKYSDKINWGYWSNKESKYTLRNMELSIPGEVLDNIFHHTNHYIFIIQPKLKPRK
jgi:hypothetical protein